MKTLEAIELLEELDFSYFQVHDVLLATRDYGKTVITLTLNSDTITFTTSFGDITLTKSRGRPIDKADMLRDINTYMYLLETMGAEDYGKFTKRGMSL